MTGTLRLKFNCLTIRWRSSRPLSRRLRISFFLSFFLFVGRSVGRHGNASRYGEFLLMWEREISRAVWTRSGSSRRDERNYAVKRTSTTREIWLTKQRGKKKINYESKACEVFFFKETLIFKHLYFKVPCQFINLCLFFCFSKFGCISNAVNIVDVENILHGFWR